MQPNFPSSSVSDILRMCNMALDLLLKIEKKEQIVFSVIGSWCYTYRVGQGGEFTTEMIYYFSTFNTLRVFSVNTQKTVII